MKMQEGPFKEQLKKSLKEYDELPEWFKEDE
jgi:hypothetical protein